MVLCLQIPVGHSHGCGNHSAPVNHAAQPHMTAGAWSYSALDEWNSTRGTRQAMEDRKLGHCKPLTQILSFYMTPFGIFPPQKDTSANFLSTSCISLQPGLFTNAELDFLCTYPLRSLLPRLCPQVRQNVLLGKSHLRPEECSGSCRGQEQLHKVCIHCSACF